MHLPTVETVLTALLVAVALAACGGSYDAIRPNPILRQGMPANPNGPESVAVLIGAGDIGDCDSPGDERTAAIVDSVLEAETAPVWVFTLGDNAYERATTSDFRRCYEPGWGRFRAVTRPVPGNHDYKNGQLLGFLPLFGNADAYFAYFSAFPGQAGEPDEGFYHYRHGAWDVYALNTGKTRHIEPDGRLWNWLLREFEKPDRAACAVAYYHYPRFSVGKHSDDERMRAGWELLQRHGVDLFLAGHDHNYQHYAPQDADGAPDSTGVRQFVVGTGGTALRPRASDSRGRLERWTDEHWGVLKLTLYPDRYAWEFITGEGEVWDSGSSPCQNTR